MLQNRIYRGEIVHKDKNYPGEHEAIVDEALWNEVQAILAEQPRRSSAWNSRQASQACWPGSCSMHKASG